MYVTHTALASFHCVQPYHVYAVSPCSVGWVEFMDEKQLLEAEQELMLAARGESFWKCFRTSAISRSVKFSRLF